MAVYRWADKDPGVVQPRGLDWIKQLPAGDPINPATVVWSCQPPGLQLSAPAVEGTVTLVNVGAGQDGTDYQVTCKFETVAGLDFEGSAQLFVRNL